MVPLLGGNVNWDDPGAPGVSAINSCIVKVDRTRSRPSPSIDQYGKCVRRGAAGKSPADSPPKELSGRFMYYRVTVMDASTWHGRFVYVLPKRRRKG